LPGWLSSPSRAPLCVSPVQRGDLPAGLSRQGACAVLVRSSNPDLFFVRSLRFLRGTKLSADSHSASSGFSSPLAAASPIRIAAPVRPGAGGSVSYAPRATPLPAPFAGSRAHQLHPTFLRFDPELSRGVFPDFLGLRLIRPSVRPWFCQRTRKESQKPAAPSIVFLHKMLVVNCL
jgi:hypothetical protein